MNVNFEAIEKAWFKPKKDTLSVLNELEEWAKENIGICRLNQKYEKTNRYYIKETDYIVFLDKIQELKKENENE